MIQWVIVDGIKKENKVMRLFLVIITCVFIYNIAYCNDTISVGEAYDIANRDVVKNYNIDLQNYDTVITVNAPTWEMKGIKGAISEKQQDLLEKLKNKSYIAVQYADKRIIGKGHAVGITYYIDLSNGSIIEIYKTR